MRLGKRARAKLEKILAKLKAAEERIRNVGAYPTGHLPGRNARTELQQAIHDLEVAIQPDDKFPRW